MRNIFLTGAMVAALGFAGTAHALIVTGSGTVAGVTVSASADFEIVGNTLTITLTDTTASNQTLGPGSTLDGIAFTFQNTKLNLVPASALVNTAATPGAIINTNDCTSVPVCSGSNIDVGGEWGLDNGTSDIASLQSKDAVGSVGYIHTPLTGNIGNFETGGTAGPNIAGPDSLDGIQMGIISSGSSLSNGLDGNALIRNAVVLTLTGVGGDLSNPGTLSAEFLYGTSSSDFVQIGGSCGANCIVITGGGGAVPEPATVGLFGTALLGFAAAHRRKRTV